LALNLKFKSYSLDKIYFGKMLPKSIGLSCNHPYIQSLILLLIPKPLLNPKHFGIHLISLCEIAKVVLLHACCSFTRKLHFPCNFESQKTLKVKVNEILGSIYNTFFGTLKIDSLLIKCSKEESKFY